MANEERRRSTTRRQTQRAGRIIDKLDRGNLMLQTTSHGSSDVEPPGLGGRLARRTATWR
jgi:hypothetical protein